MPVYIGNLTPQNSGPEREDDQTITVTVQVSGFGKPSQIQREALQEMGRALANTFGSDRYRMFLGGRRVLFDPLAHDGEHPGHDTILTIEEP